MEFRQLIPEPAAVDVAGLLAGIDLAGRAGDERPYTIANFISSADGRAAFHGRSNALGDDADRELFHGLREQVDAVFAGTGTLRAERYGRLIPDPGRRRRREQAGRSPEPLACVISRSGQLPLEIPLFSEPEARIVVFGPGEAGLADCTAQVDCERLDPGEMTLTNVMRRLRHDYGIRSLLCEGGPTVFGALLREGLVDELLVTLAPKLVGGGSAPTIAMGSELPELAALELVWALEHSSALYLRYALR